MVKTLKELLEEKSLKKKIKETLENAVKVTKTEEYSDIISSITEKSNQKQQLEKWRFVINGLRHSIDKLRTSYFPSLHDENTEEGTEIKNESENSISKKYQEAYAQIKTNIAKSTKILDKENFKDSWKKESALDEEIKALEKNLSDMLRESGISDENTLQIKSAPQKIVAMDNEILNIDKKIKDKEKEIIDYNDILKKVKEEKEKYEKAIKQGIEPLVITLKEQARRK